MTVIPLLTAIALCAPPLAATSSATPSSAAAATSSATSSHAAAATSFAAATSTASADAASLSPATIAVSREADPASATFASARLPLLGVMLSGGVPDGGVVSLVVRPWKWVRADGGLAYNALSLGAQGGVTLVPFHWGIVPTLRFEGGRFFRADVNGKVARWAGDVPTYLRPALEGFGYDYASAQVGFEVGSQRRFVFFVRGGLAWVRGEFGDGRGLRDDDNPGTEMDVKGLRITATGPTASLGFLCYVW